jgi:preprotein translocase subunit YajC
MYNVGQKVMVRKTGAYGIVKAVRGSTIEVLVEDAHNLRFDRSSLELVPSGTRKAH